MMLELIIHMAPNADLGKIWNSYGLSEERWSVEQITTKKPKKFNILQTYTVFHKFTLD